MTRVLILDESQIAQQLWKLKVRKMIPDSEVVVFSNIEELLDGFSEQLDFQQEFDVIISDFESISKILSC